MIGRGMSSGRAKATQVTLGRIVANLMVANCHSRGTKECADCIACFQRTILSFSVMLQVIPV
jgi:hypothetical protein